MKTVEDMYDLRTSGNAIIGRNILAYVCNSGDITVLKADATKEQKYKREYEKYDTVRVAWNYKGRENYSDGTLAWSKENHWIVSNGGCCLTNSFTFQDALKMVNDATAPIVRKDDVVAIAIIRENTLLVELYRVTHTDIHCQVSAEFKPLDNDEMNIILNNAKRWLRF